MRRPLQIPLTVEPPPPGAHHRSLRRCYGCGNYTRPFVEMDGVIRCERCAKKTEREEPTKEDLSSIEDFGLIS